MAEYENENVIVGAKGWDAKGLMEDAKKYNQKEYAAAICECLNTLYIKQPKNKGFHSIKCPECGFEINLFCGLDGEKAKMSDLL